MITREAIVDLMEKSGIDVDRKTMTFESTFEDLGIDSLDAFNLFAEIEAVTGIDVPDEDFEDLDSVEAIFKYLKDRV